MKNLLNQIDTKKPVGVDMIHPKLIKVASNFSAPILITAINSTIEKRMFPDNAKVSTVVP